MLLQIASPPARTHLLGCERDEILLLVRTDLAQHLLRRTQMHIESARVVETGTLWRRALAQLTSTQPLQVSSGIASF